MLIGHIPVNTFEQGLSKEWVIANGIGGYASSTVVGANTRKYHGLLVASLRPPVERTLLLSKLDEELIIDGKVFKLSTNETATVPYPDGHRYLQGFRMNPFPTYIYSVSGAVIEKTIFMLHGENSTVIRYNIFTDTRQKVDFTITPLINARGYHHNTRQNDWPFNEERINQGVAIEAYEGAPKLYLYSDLARYNQGDGHWFLGMYYRNEAERGLDAWDDHYMPGSFTMQTKGMASFSIMASTSEVSHFHPVLLQYREEKRLQEVVARTGYDDDFSKQLVLTADTFIVDRLSTGNKTVIAGYPWFTDWGRDSMISLPGLTLVTGRHAEAKEILRTFARYCRDGLLPNTFPDEGEEPYYNSVDASLWFFIAAYRYVNYTEDYTFTLHELYPVLEHIIDAYQHGTLFNIGMDEDGLIYAGSEGVQLTWMDAKVGDWVVTPRHGKPVEINALWFNALKIMAHFALEKGEDPEQYEVLADRVKSSFERVFWNPDKYCLYDVVGIREDGVLRKDDAVRPNQVFAVSLPFQLLDEEKARQVVLKVWKDLYVGVGLRSLSPDQREYKKFYKGNVVQRDGAYHQGTAWSWLLGPFLTAFLKVNEFNLESKEIAEKLLAPIKAHLLDNGLGTIAEIFDGDYPHTPRGCISQAWGVAEILRFYVEDLKGLGPNYEFRREQNEPVST